MRGRCRVFSVLAVFSAVLIVSAVFASGVVNPSAFTLNTMYGVQPNNPGPNDLSFNPDPLIGDYFDPGFTIGDKFNVTVVATDVTDLFTWHLNVTWNPAILNFSRLASYGNLLNQTGSPYGTSRIEPIVGPDYTAGYAWIAETILGDVGGVTGSGSLAVVEFEVVGYGCSNLTISTEGTLPTTLLDSNGASISFTPIDGYFKNKLLGDSNGDGVVNVADMGVLSASWTGVPGALPYDRDVDNNDDGVINVADMGVSSANWGRTAP